MRSKRSLVAGAVAAGEVRDGQAGEGEEEWFGDAGSAVMLGCEGVIAEILGVASRSDDFLDEWRGHGWFHPDASVTLCH